MNVRWNLMTEEMTAEYLEWNKSARVIGWPKGLNFDQTIRYGHYCLMRQLDFYGTKTKYNIYSFKQLVDMLKSDWFGRISPEIEQELKKESK